MQTRSACGILGLVTLSVCVPTLGQSASWRTELLGDADGSSDFGPGETPIVRYSVEFSPLPGEPFDKGDVLGFGFLGVDFLGALNWATGEASWTVNPDLIYATGDLTAKDGGTQDLLGMQLAQYPRSIFSLADPIWIADIAWDPGGDYARRRVELTSDARAPLLGQPDDSIGVWYERLSGGAATDYWPIAPATIGFEVVPPPASASPFLLLIACRCQRPRT